ncbi:DUF4190 domain-containing protein [Arthrobacter sp. 92]|jgi:hypothetical protein|uniref:DUF4190 domain-containing protein n=1 Tax=Arthrobacter sp. 92 TaxID=3418175 RepID=UPI003D0844C2
MTATNTKGKTITDQPDPREDRTPQENLPASHIPPQEPEMSPPSVPSEFPAPLAGPSDPATPEASADEIHPAQPDPFAAAYGRLYGAPPEPKGLSIASLCCGIAVYLGFGLLIMPQIAAVILGHMALQREPAGRSLAIAGLVLGYIALVITAIVLALAVIAVLSAENGVLGQ